MTHFYFSAVRMLVEDLEEDLQGHDTHSMRAEFLCANKMLAYLWSSFICHIDNHFQKDSNDIDNIGKVSIIFVFEFIF